MKMINNKNKFNYELETIDENITLCIQWLTMQIANKNFSLDLEKAIGFNSLLQHAQSTIEKYIVE